MASPQPNRVSSRYRWIICMCHWLWKSWIGVWGTLLGILSSVFATLLFFRWPWSNNAQLAQSGSVVNWAVLHPGILLIFGLALLLVVIILFLISRLPCNEPEEVQQGAQKPHLVVEASAGHTVANGGTMIGNTIVFGDYTHGTDGKERSSQP